MIEDGQKPPKLTGSFTTDFLTFAWKKVVLLAFVNVVPSLFIVVFVRSVDSAFDGDIFQASAAFIAIITAVVTFYGAHAEDEVDWLYQKKKELLPVHGSIQGLGGMLLRSIFLQYVLWWTLVTSAVAFALSAVQLVASQYMEAGVVGLVFLSASVISIIYWMTVFIFSSTSGKGDYEGLMATATTGDGQGTHSAGSASP